MTPKAVTPEQSAAEQSAAEQPAETVWSAWRTAELDSRRDMNVLRGQALEASRRQAVRMFPLTPRTGPRAVVNVRGGEVLRHWYTDVYAAALARRLGEPVIVPAAAEVDATATVLRRALKDPVPDLPLRLAGSVHQAAVHDAATTATGLHASLTGAGPQRAGVYAAQHPLTSENRTAVLEHWYLRCYLAVADAQLGLLPPIQTVTGAEAREVAASIHDGQAARLIGHDGVPLVTAHGTAMTDNDRSLAAGDTGVVPPPQLRVTNPLLREQVTRSWNYGGGFDTPQDLAQRRTAWAVTAGVPATATNQTWDQLRGQHQTQLIASWLDTHRAPDARLKAGPTPPDPPFARSQHELTGAPREAAAAMFNHAARPIPYPAVVALFPMSATGAIRKQTAMPKVEDNGPRGHSRSKQHLER